MKRNEQEGLHKPISRCEEIPSIRVQLSGRRSFFVQNPFTSSENQSFVQAHQRPVETVRLSFVRSKIKKKRDSTLKVRN